MRVESRENAMRNDLAELTALNRDYVDSVHNSDVKRFDEILAEDFYCSQSRQVAGRPRRLPRADGKAGGGHTI